MVKNKSNNLPAFPSEVGYIDGKQQESFQSGNYNAKFSGLTMRDYFATRFMQSCVKSEGMTSAQMEDIAHQAYNMADAMLEQRSK
jgi:hypothetical protein